jgi:RNA polymerase sigma-70 factor (ECF subfamily)
MRMATGPRIDPEELLLAARKGGSEELGRLLQFYRDYLHLLARTQVDLHLARRASPSDLVQETLLNACRGFSRFRGTTESELLAWLRKILLNNLRRLVSHEVTARKRSLRREVSLDQCLDDLERSAAAFEDFFASQASSPSRSARRRESAAILAAKLAELSPAHRDVIVLRNLEGLSFDEVAERMGRSAGAVRMLWLRALGKLREILDAEDLE